MLLFLASTLALANVISGPHVRGRVPIKVIQTSMRQQKRWGNLREVSPYALTLKYSKGMKTFPTLSTGIGETVGQFPKGSAVQVVAELTGTGSTRILGVRWKGKLAWIHQPDRSIDGRRGYAPPQIPGGPQTGPRGPVGTLSVGQGDLATVERPKVCFSLEKAVGVPDFRKFQTTTPLSTGYEVRVNETKGDAARVDGDCWVSVNDLFPPKKETTALEAYPEKLGTTLTPPVVRKKKRAPPPPARSGPSNDNPYPTLESDPEALSPERPDEGAWEPPIPRGLPQGWFDSRLPYVGSCEVNSGAPLALEDLPLFSGTIEGCPRPQGPCHKGKPRSSQYDHWIKEEAARFGVDPALLKGLIHAESNFQMTAENQSEATNPYKQKGLRGYLFSRGLGQYGANTAPAYGLAWYQDVEELTRMHPELRGKGWGELQAECKRTQQFCVPGMTFRGKTLGSVFDAQMNIRATARSLCRSVSNSARGAYGNLQMTPLEQCRLAAADHNRGMGRLRKAFAQSGGEARSFAELTQMPALSSQKINRCYVTKIAGVCGDEENYVRDYSQEFGRGYCTGGPSRPLNCEI